MTKERIGIINNNELILSDTIPPHYHLWKYDSSKYSFKERIIILSWLNFYISEDFPLVLSFRFKENDGVIQLFFNDDIPIYISSSNHINTIYKEHIENALKQENLVVFSSDQLHLYDELPLWYINGMIMDLSDDTIQGKTTKKYFVLAVPGVEMNSIQMRNIILENADQFIFPSNVSKLMIMTHSLEDNGEGMFIPSITIPKGFNPFRETFQQSFTFPNITMTFYFMYLLSLTPTWNFIREEFIIRILERGVIIRHNTLYMPDAIRVFIASKVNNLSHNFNELEIQMSTEQPTFKNYITFFDEENMIDVWLYQIGKQQQDPKTARSQFLRIPQSIDLEDLSLQNRINIDYPEY